MELDTVLDTLTNKKKKLDTYRPFPPEQLQNLLEWFDVEYTYTSNAIEGNTLSRSETALIIDKGITVHGKTLREHLEARNHDKAIHFVRSLIQKNHQYISEDDIRAIHKIVLAGVNDTGAGTYRRVDVFIRGAAVESPPPHLVPHRMTRLVAWLQENQEGHPAQIAADLHYRLVEIHPFIDGNGRTARLLMNLVLMQHGYPIAIIKTEERDEYIDSINKATVMGDHGDFYTVMYRAVERSLDAYIAAGQGKSIIPFYIGTKNFNAGALLKIGELAHMATVSIPTIRHYIAMQLITPTTRSKGGFMLFEPRVVEIIYEIKRLQKEKRLSVTEIAQYLRENKQVI